MKMDTKRLALFALAAIATAAPARAEVTRAAADSFLVEHKLAVAAAPGKVFEALGQPGRWWSDAHTYSGRASNLSLTTEAGGCFCERWSGGSVEHGRVVLVRRDTQLRLEAALGPLQEMAVEAVLTFTLAARDGSTDLTLTYRVSGDPAHKLDGLAAIVDTVIGEQVQRLKRLVDTGSAAGGEPRSQ
jgi:uncharacterized protein YndB with AHSA1/START domain